MKEVWKPVPGYEELYLISNTGRLKSLDRITNYRLPGFTVHKKGRILKPNLKNTGYYEYALSKNKQIKWVRAHRLVALAFIPNPNNYNVINHINEDKTDNRVENLEWCSSKYNIECYHKNRTLIYQYNKTGILMKKWNSIVEAASSVQGDKTGVQHCCRGELKTYKNYIWSYFPITSEELLHRNTKNNMCKVGQYTKEDVLLAVYSSYREAGKAVGCVGSAISMCCNGKRNLIKGYKWKRL